MWTDEISLAEVKFTERAMRELETVPWAKPLIRRVGIGGGLVARNMPLLFEVRFAFELYRRGATADYEYSAGAGNSSVDFRVHGSAEWLIEMVSVRPSDAVKRATRQTGLIYETLLRTEAPGKGQSEEAEMITAQQKIGEKVFKDGVPIKFSIPKGAVHAIVTDMRGYL